MILGNRLWKWYLMLSNWVMHFYQKKKEKKESNTWEIVSCPLHFKPLGCKWVYSVKLKVNGSLDRYKAWLVARRNKQEYGIDCDEMFAPIAKMTTIRLICSCRVSNMASLSNASEEYSSWWSQRRSLHEGSSWSHRVIVPSTTHVFWLTWSLYCLKTSSRSMVWEIQSSNRPSN